MNGEEFKIKTEPLDINEEWPVDSNQLNVKKENEINDETKDKDIHVYVFDETKGQFAPKDLNFVKLEKMSDAAPAAARPAKAAPNQSNVKKENNFVKFPENMSDAAPNQLNVKKENEINDETKGHFALPDDLNFVKFPGKMSEAGPAAAAAPKAKKAAPTHPPSTVMVLAAVKALKARKGSSLAAIKKYINTNYEVNIVKLAPFIRKGIRTLVMKDVLIQVKGSWKVAKAGEKNPEKKVAHSGPEIFLKIQKYTREMK